MTYFDEEVRDLLQFELKEGLLRIVGPSEPVFAALQRAFPVLGSKIDWKKLAVHKTLSFDTQSESNKVIKFLSEILDELGSDQIATYIGDGATSFAIGGSLRSFVASLERLLSIPQHHYFLGQDFEWCFCISFEGHADFGAR